jgi:hypothetical protein
MPGMSTFLAGKVIDHLLRNQAYTPPTTVYLSLHTGDPGLTGLNEVTGGSYVRQACALTAAASGHTDNSGLISFTSMPAIAAPGVVFGGLWDASTVGNFLVGGPMTPAAQLTSAFSALASTDLITSYGHGLTTNDAVEFETAEGTVLPTGLTAGTVYYVIATGLTTDAFEVSATVGGAAVNITANGNGIVRKLLGKVVNSGDTFQVAIGDFDLTLTF